MVFIINKKIKRKSKSIYFFCILKLFRYVTNGANVGNAVLQFDLEGNYLGEVGSISLYPLVI